MGGKSSEDYVFRYKLDLGEKDHVYEDRLVELIRSQLENLLNVVTFVSGQREVKVDGFRLLRDRETTYQIFPADGHSGE